MTPSRIPAPRGVDVTTPNTARMYDYVLGGKENFQADRDTADRLLAIVPELKAGTLANRAFLGRAVRFLAASGVRQFLDIGTGLPTRGNVHEIAHEVAPDARVVYSDYDPVVLTHGRALLANNDKATVIQADLREPAQLLAHHDLQAMIDLDQPIAVLLVAILHFIDDADKPAEIIGQFRDSMAPGSYLVISHGTSEGHDPESVAAGMAVYHGASAQLVLRSAAEIGQLFDGFDLVEPGLVEASKWHPDDPVTAEAVKELWYLAGVGRKPPP